MPIFFFLQVVSTWIQWEMSEVDDDSETDEEQKLLEDVYALTEPSESLVYRSWSLSRSLTSTILVADPTIRVADHTILVAVSVAEPPRSWSLSSTILVVVPVAVPAILVVSQ
uniref:Secreted protein n=1 Tax=Caenorhabditis tropicalis TaxID=1561998 RepID=A0A1I7UGI9_9PELO